MKNTINLLPATSLFVMTLFAVPAVAAGETNAYIGGNLGVARIDTRAEIQQLANDVVAAGYSSAAVTMEQGSTSFKILGGYQINPNLAIEGYYANLGKYDFTLSTTGPTLSGKGDVGITGFGVDVLGILPLDASNSVFARIGLFGWDSKGTFAVTGGKSFSASDSGTDLKFGLGYDWKITPKLLLRTEWEYYKLDPEISVLSAGFTYRF